MGSKNKATPGKNQLTSETSKKESKLLERLKRQKELLKEQERLHKEQEKLINDLVVQLSNFDVNETIQLLSDAACDVRVEVCRAIREDHPDDTDWHLDKVYAIINAMAHLHITNNAIDDYHGLNKIYRAHSAGELAFAMSMNDKLTQ